MTGKQHYEEAERLLDVVKTVEAGSVGEAGILAEAQAHATLALVAVTMISGGATEWGCPS